MLRGLVQSGGSGQVLVSLDTYWWITERGGDQSVPTAFPGERLGHCSWSAGETALSAGRWQVVRCELWPCSRNDTVSLEKGPLQHPGHIGQWQNGLIVGNNSLELMSSRHWIYYLIWSQRAESSRTQEQSRLARGLICFSRWGAREERPGQSPG